MTKSVRFLILIIGTLSLASGIFLAATGSDFMEYFTGIFFALVLIGTAMINRKDKD